MIYLDDVIVVGKMFEYMIENFIRVFDCIVVVGLKFKLKKCVLFLCRVLYFGYVIMEYGIFIDLEKV